MPPRRASKLHTSGAALTKMPFGAEGDITCRAQACQRFGGLLVTDAKLTPSAADWLSTTVPSLSLYVDLLER